MEFKKGVLFLADVIDYTSQANRLGPQKTAYFNHHFEEKIREVTHTHGGVFIKTIGDAVLIFFPEEKPFLEFVIELRDLSMNRGLDLGEFFADLRMVAHYANFSFETVEEKTADLVGPEGIKVFRIEKYAGEYDVIITNSVLGVIRNLLDEKNISFTKAGIVELKGFDEEAILYKLNFPINGEKTAAALLCIKMGALETETRVIPVFGDLYPAMNMEDNFINLDIKTGDQPLSTRYDFDAAPDREGDEWEERPGIDLRWKRERDSERPGYVDVKTLYDIRHHGIILGLPGSGKTTILKYFAYRDFKENRKIQEEDKKRVVLFIPCRNILSYNDWARAKDRPCMDAGDMGAREPRPYMDKDISIVPVRAGSPRPAFNVENVLFYLTYCFLYNKEAVKDEKEKQELRIAEKLVHQAYTAGRLTLLIDALDEAPSKEIKECIAAGVKLLFTDISTGSRRDKGNRVFLTSRFSEREMYFTGKGSEMLKPQFEVRSLDMEQLREMARYFYGEKTALYKEFDDIVWQEEIAAKVAGTPITALLVIAYYEIFRQFDTRYHMYNIIVVFILVRVWKQIKEEHFDKDMRVFFKEAKSKEVLKEEKNAREIYDALSLLSYEHLEKGAVMYEKDIAGIFELFAREKVEEKEAAAEAEQWLKQLKEDHLLIPAGADEYVFIHNTVMEYLAARYIVDGVGDPTPRRPFGPSFGALIGAPGIPVILSERQGRMERPGPGDGFFKGETLPIAVGSGIKNGAALLRMIHECILKEGNKERKESLYRLAQKGLAEWESYIDRKYQRSRLDLLHRKMEEEIAENRDAVDWIYKYLAQVILSADKEELKERLETFKNLPRLSRPYFIQGYLSYENYSRGDSEMVSLRETLLRRAIDSEWVDTWLGEDGKVGEKALLDKEVNLLTLDSEGYHPEDKNYRYYREYTGKELVGFLGSPNFKHSSSVTCVAVSPDGNYFLSGSEDNTLKLWDAAIGKEMRTFKGHTDTVRSVGFAPDGKTILSGSYDGTLKLWDAVTGQDLRTFKGHTDMVWCVGFAPDGKTLLSSSLDNTLKLWDAVTGIELCTFNGHSEGVASVGFSPDGKTVLSGSLDDTLKLWEAVTGQEIRTFTGHKEIVTSVGYAPDGKTVLSGSRDSTLKLWDAATGRELRTFKGHTGPVTSVGFAPDGKTVLSGSYDRTLKLWDAVTGQKLRTFKGHSLRVTSVGFAPDGKTVLSGSADTTLKLWDAAIGKEMRTFKGHEISVISVGFAPDGKTLISGSEDFTLKLWDVSSGKEMRTFKGHKDRVTSVGFAPDGKTLLSGSYDATLKLWDFATGKEIRTFKEHFERVTSVGFAPDGKTVLSGSEYKALKLWDAATGQEMRTFKGHEGTVTSVGFAPDGKTVLSGSVDETIKLWDAATGNELRTFKGHNGSVSSVDFAPDGKTLLSGSWDFTLKLWDVATGRCIKTIPLLWIPLDIKARPGKPGLFATANANGTVTLFDFTSELLALGS